MNPTDPNSNPSPQPLNSSLASDMPTQPATDSSLQPTSPTVPSWDAQSISVAQISPTPAPAPDSSSNPFLSTNPPLGQAIPAVDTQTPSTAPVFSQDFSAPPTSVQDSNLSIAAPVVPDVSMLTGFDANSGSAPTTPVDSLPPTPTSVQDISAQSQPSLPAAPVATDLSSYGITSNESVPTDLSHLTSSSVYGGSTESTIPSAVDQAAQPVVSVVPEVNQVSTNNPGGSFPVWVFAVGGLILVLVFGASLYFILGIGQPDIIDTRSLPAQQPALTNPPGTLIDDSSSFTQNSGTNTFNSSTGSGTLTPTLTATPSASPTGTSAVDILRQRNSE